MDLFRRAALSLALAGPVLASLGATPSAQADICGPGKLTVADSGQFEWTEGGKLRGIRFVPSTNDWGITHALEGSVLVGCKNCAPSERRMGGRVFIELRKAPASGYSQLLAPERVKSLLMKWIGFGDLPKDFSLEAEGAVHSATVFGTKGKSARFVAHGVGAKTPRNELLAVTTSRGCFSVTVVVSRGDKPITERDALSFYSAFSLVSYAPKPPPLPPKPVFEQLKGRSVLEILGNEGR